MIEEVRGTVTHVCQVRAEQGEAGFIVSCQCAPPPASGYSLALLTLQRSRDVGTGTKGKRKIISILRAGKTKLSPENKLGTTYAALSTFELPEERQAFQLLG